MTTTFRQNNFVNASDWAHIGSIEQYSQVNMDEVRVGVQNMNTARLVPLSFPKEFSIGTLDDDIEATHKQSRFSAVQNTASGKLTMAVTDRYKILQHKEAFDPIIDSIENLGEDIYAKLEDTGNEGRLYLLFPNLRIKDDADGMMPGLRFFNSYKDKMSFKAHFFAWRIRCMNGSIFSRIVREENLSGYHTMNSLELLKEKLPSFVDGMLQNVYRIEEIIDEAMHAEVTFSDWAEVANTIKPIVGTEKATEAVVAQPELTLNTNRWAVYNAITAVASHEQLSAARRDDIIAAAERHVLINRDFEPIPVPVEA